MRKLQIDHRTQYRFGAPVTLLPHRLLLRPRESHGLRIANSVLDISVPHTIRWQHDAFDNSVAQVSFSERASSLVVASRISIEHYDEAPLDFVVETHAASHPFQYDAEDALVLSPLCTLALPDDRAVVADWLRALGLGSMPIETFVLLDQINRAISRDFRYEAREAPGVQTPAL